ncbi:MAG: hypothetical protein WCX48_10755 [Bacteroidales bacterium]
MKKLKIFICLAALIAPFFASCTKDDADIKFSKKNVEIIIGKTEKITISGGESPYTVASSDATIASATIADKEITLTSIKKGNVIVTVTDKAGKTGKLSVAAINDPYEALKADSKTRFVWNGNSKIEGTDAGTYKMIQGTDGKVEFSWKSTDAKSTITLTYPDKAGSMTEGAKKGAKITINGKETQVSSLIVVQIKALVQGDKNTVWIWFKASDKEGACVGKMS